MPKTRTVAAKSQSIPTNNSKSVTKTTMLAKSPATATKPVRSIRSSAETTAASSDPNAPQLSDSEISVLTVFRTYLMTPGKMLCLSNTDVGSMKKSLERLCNVGMLLPESFKGGYSLTRLGFQTMKGLNTAQTSKR